MIEFNNMDLIQINNHNLTIKNLKTLSYDKRLEIFENLEKIQLNYSNNYLDVDLLNNKLHH